MDAPSGTGKSSLINAGLQPALERYGFTVISVRFADHARAVDTPAGNPFEAAIVAAIGQATGTPLAETDLVNAMAGLRKDGSGGYVLLLDQFEEIFSGFPGSWHLRTPFFRSVARGLRLNQTLRLLIAIRSDYVASLAPYQRQIPGELVVRYNLESLRDPEARDAIQRAFVTTDRSLSTDELDALIAGLFTLWSGETKLDVPAEFVNLIQLQIVCRGQWESAPIVGTGESGDMEGSKPAVVDVDSAMNAFVDNAVIHTVTDTGCDEAAIRAWLESELITPGDRRSVVLVGTTTTGGLNNDVVGVLERERLIAYQQRNDDRWVELTHDSMIGAIHRSNDRWHEVRRRRLAKRRNRLALLFALLIGLFFVLRQSSAGSAERLVVQSGVLSDDPERFEFTAPVDGVILTSGDVFTDIGVDGRAPPILRVTSISGEPETVVSSELRFENGDPSTEFRTVDVPFRAVAGDRYAAVLEPGGSVGSTFDLAITAVPVAIDADEAAADHIETLETDIFAVEAGAGAPILVSVENGFIDEASGVDVMMVDEVTAVISPSERTSHAVFSVSSYAPLRVHTNRLDGEVEHLDVNETRSLTITEGGARLLFEKTGAEESFVIGATCNWGDVSVIVYDDHDRVVASTTDGSRFSGSQSEQFLVATLAEGSYHALFIPTRSFFEERECTVGALGLADRTMVGPGELRLPSAAMPGFEAFLLEPNSEAIVVVDGDSGVGRSLRCGQSVEPTFADDDGQLVAVVSPDEVCALVLVHTDEVASGSSRVRVISLVLEARR